MDNKAIIDTILSGVPGIHIQAQDHLRVDEEIDFIATQLNFKVSEWNWGYGWVNFKNKQPLNFGSNFSFYEDLQTIADDNLGGRLYVIKNAYSVLTNDIRAVARLQQELLRIKRSFCGNSAVLFVTKERIDFSDISDLIVTFHCPPLASHQVEQVFYSFLEKHSISVSTEVKNTATNLSRDKFKNSLPKSCTIC